MKPTISINNQKSIFELGRGAKEKEHGWHQYILAYDFSQTETPFLLSEQAGKETVFRKYLTISELVSELWEDYIALSRCKQIVKAYQSNPGKTRNKIHEVKEDVHRFGGNWKSEEVIPVLNYKSNFENWIGVPAVPGIFRFCVHLQELNDSRCSVEIPVGYSGTDHGCYAIYSGRFEPAYRELLIWQNDTFPVTVPFSWSKDRLVLRLFGKRIQFVKEQSE